LSRKSRKSGGAPPSRGSRPHESRGEREARRDKARAPESNPDRRRMRPPRPDPDTVLIFGFHAVREALRSPRRKLLRLRATPSASERLANEIAAAGVALELASNEEIAARLPPQAAHQGLLLEARPLAAMDIADLPDDGLVLVLDQITDPHNVGAILRTAAAFAVDAIVTTERHAPAHSGVLAKSASGGLEHVPIVTVVNLARAMEALGDRGYLRIGLDSDAPAPLRQTPMRRPLALALGAEGKGLRRLTRENCDVMARLDLPGAVRSLNVSNACAIGLAFAHAALSVGA
jgi:23S rRNA (guanosine2251-2'-O)-methyltransferase